MSPDSVGAWQALDFGTPNPQSTQRASAGFEVGGSWKASGPSIRATLFR